MANNKHHLPLSVSLAESVSVVDPVITVQIDGTVILANEKLKQNTLVEGDLIIEEVDQSINGKAVKLNFPAKLKESLTVDRSGDHLRCSGQQQQNVLLQTVHWRPDQGNCVCVFRRCHPQLTLTWTFRNY